MCFISYLYIYAYILYAPLKFYSVPHISEFLNTHDNLLGTDHLPGSTGIPGVSNDILLFDFHSVSEVNMSDIILCF